MKKLFLLLALFSANLFATPVNINKADAATIEKSLTGIGAVKAKAIVDYRTKNGDYKTAEDLLNVNGVGEKTLLKNKSDILLTGATATTADTKKEAKVDAKTDVKAVVKKEIKSDVKQDVKTKVKVEAKKEIKADTKTDVKKEAVATKVESKKDTTIDAKK
ncbi:MAG: helix-hairpin-helix domain-containing protein [Methylococcales bacterium]|nr:helix-hairpin-helix domain-containing protein [Methylococcales bacterium]